MPSVPPCSHLFGSLESDGHAPGGLATGGICLRALSLCKCRQVVGHDDLTHHNAVPQGMVHQFLSLLGGEDQHPLAWLKGCLQGLGQIPTSLVDLGTLGWV